MADNNRYSGKRLVRSTRGAVLGGVAAGIGDYFGIEPTIVRLAFVLLAFVTSFWGAVVAYILALIIIPEGTPGSSSAAGNNAAEQAHSSQQGEETILNMEAESNQEGDTKYTYRMTGSNNNKAMLWIGVFLAILGVYLLINNFFGNMIRPYLHIIRNATFSSLLILGGIYLIVRKN
ncbi:MAG: PspC domain-containing protein [Bacillota bacterium]